jgi:hypothetical protein
MAKKTLDIKAKTVTNESPEKSTPTKKDKLFSKLKPSPDFISTPVEEIDDLERNFKHLDYLQISITIALAIIALWSAYFVTRLLSNQTSPLESITKLISKSPKSNKDDSQKSKDNTSTQTQTDNASSTQTTTNPFAPIDSQGDSTDTKNDTASQPTEIAKDSFSIRILNGNGITGDAAKLKSDLESKGFKVGTTSNAQLKYDKTEIYYVAGQLDQANLVNSNLTDRQTELKEESQDLIGNGYQVLVIIGKS